MNAARPDPFGPVLEPYRPQMGTKQFFADLFAAGTTACRLVERGCAAAKGANSVIKPGDVVYVHYAPQRPGVVVEIGRAEAWNTYSHDGPAEMVYLLRVRWLPLGGEPPAESVVPVAGLVNLLSLIRDQERKLTGHKERYVRALAMWEGP